MPLISKINIHFFRKSFVFSFNDSKLHLLFSKPPFYWGTPSNIPHIKFKSILPFATHYLLLLT